MRFRATGTPCRSVKFKLAASCRAPPRSLPKSTTMSLPIARTPMLGKPRSVASGSDGAAPMTAPRSLPPLTHGMRHTDGFRGHRRTEYTAEHTGGVAALLRYIAAFRNDEGWTDIIFEKEDENGERPPIVDNRGLFEEILANLTH